MKALLAFWRSEPAAISGFVATVLSLAVSFGLHLTSDQTGAILAVVPAFAALVTRSQVTPAKVPPAVIPPAPPS